MARVRPSPAAIVLVASFAAYQTGAQTLALPNRPDSLKFAVIGDSGDGQQPQYDVARQMAAARATFRFDLVVMVGDNIYGGHSPADYARKFALPYKPLLDAGVVFQATLGNHDAPESRSYRPFNMNGERYYTFTRQNVRFITLDTNMLDAQQVAWFEATLGEAREPWKICFFHHPLYSDAGRHGSSVDLRVILEPMLVKHRVNVVFSGHDHVYERIKPQKGVAYFVMGSSGLLRKGDLRPSDATAAGFDQDQAFILAEIAGSELFFETTSRTGRTVDRGVISAGPKLQTTDGAP